MKCKFIKESDEQCEANATDGSDYCFSHNPDYKEEKAIAVQKGGLNRKHYEVYGEPIIIEKPEDIKKLLAETINGVWTGKIPASQPGNTLGFLCRCWIDTHQITEVEARLEMLEEKVKLANL